ncbi:hypothetical protein HNQ08_005220 [Deinococcus humi]|uniref:Uncharacterized protein n=1 Tax=Deinococcus humi TaxID=662880 RepID=A0A7W8JZM2_9DEIO|nr:hypothetical protein [Deinococcus humi]
MVSNFRGEPTSLSEHLFIPEKGRSGGDLRGRLCGLNRPLYVNQGPSDAMLLGQFRYELFTRQNRTIYSFSSGDYVFHDLPVISVQCVPPINRWAILLS